MLRLYPNGPACTSIVRQTAILMGSAAPGQDAPSGLLLLIELCGRLHAAAYGRFDGGRIVTGRIVAGNQQAIDAAGVAGALQAGRAGKGGAFLGDDLGPQWLGQDGLAQ